VSPNHSCLSFLDHKSQKDHTCLICEDEIKHVGWLPLSPESSPGGSSLPTGVGGEAPQSTFLTLEVFIRIKGGTADYPDTRLQSWADEMYSHHGSGNFISV
jgi:hypothetical protein